MTFYHDISAEKESEFTACIPILAICFTLTLCLLFFGEFNSKQLSNKSSQTHSYAVKKR